MFLRKLHPLLRSLEEKKDDFEKLWKVVRYGWPSGLALRYANSNQKLPCLAPIRPILS